MVLIFLPLGYQVQYIYLHTYIVFKSHLPTNNFCYDIYIICKYFPDLRLKLSIIPQEPTLFIGTVRYNLDPFANHSDKELWDVLRMVRLKKHIQQLAGTL